jgi:small subunit ribosomal protein S19
MARSSWKGPFIDPQLYTLTNSNKPIHIYSRRSTILPQHLDNTFLIHNGKNFIKKKIINATIGHKFGEFANTRKIRSTK